MFQVLIIAVARIPPTSLLQVLLTTVQRCASKALKSLQLIVLHSVQLPRHNIFHFLTSRKTPSMYPTRLSLSTLTLTLCSFNTLLFHELFLQSSLPERA